VVRGTTGHGGDDADQPPTDIHEYCPEINRRWPRRSTPASSRRGAPLSVDGSVLADDPTSAGCGGVKAPARSIQAFSEPEKTFMSKSGLPASKGDSPHLPRFDVATAHAWFSGGIRRFPKTVWTDKRSSCSLRAPRATQPSLATASASTSTETAEAIGRTTSKTLS